MLIIKQNWLFKKIEKLEKKVWKFCSWSISLCNNFKDNFTHFQKMTFFLIIKIWDFPEHVAIVLKSLFLKVTWFKWSFSRNWYPDDYIIYFVTTRFVKRSPKNPLFEFSHSWGWQEFQNFVPECDSANKNDIFTFKSVSFKLPNIFDILRVIFQKLKDFEVKTYVAKTSHFSTTHEWSL